MKHMDVREWPCADDRDILSRTVVLSRYYSHWIIGGLCNPFTLLESNIP